MTDAEILTRLRLLLLGFSILLFIGTLAELWLTDHMEGFIQLIPFGLCALGLLVVLIVLWRPRRASLLLLRVSMVLVVLGSLFGVYQHVTNNIAFQREIDPNAQSADIIKGALGGANPLLAPGILAMAAMLALTATYRHPNSRKDITHESD